MEIMSIWLLTISPTSSHSFYPISFSPHLLQPYLFRKNPTHIPFKIVSLPPLCYFSFGFLVYSFILCVMIYNYIFTYVLTVFFFSTKSFNCNALHHLTSARHSGGLVECVPRGSV